MNKPKRLGRWIRALSLALIFALVISFFNFESKCQNIRDSILRLHVLANSNSEEDQALKLKVRDAILEQSAGLFDQSRTRQEAAQVARQQLSYLQQVAQQRVYEEGYQYPVKVELCEMFFTTRQYDQGTLPAGVYQAVRVTIGEGTGRNWWCVVFPPICVSSATEEHTTLRDVLDDPEHSIVTEPQKYEIRLKMVELFEQACQTVRDWFA